MTLSSSKLIIAAGFAAFALVASCSRVTQPESELSVKPPFQSVQVAPVTYSIDAEKGGTIHLDNGTKIIIPANAFADAEGNPVKGKVNLQYREFHTAGDIMASGIPMSYDSAGQHLNFQSAGMFDINGSTADHKEVTIVKGKSIDVQMASFTDGNQYSFYKFDKNGKGWNLEGTAKAPEKNTEKEKQLADFKAKNPEPVMPKEAKNDGVILNLDIDYSIYPELKPFDGVLWQYAGDEPMTNEKMTAMTDKYAWSNIDLRKDSARETGYKVELKSGSHRLEIPVEPVLRGKNLAIAKARFRSQMTAYNDAKQKIRDEQRILDEQANLVRSFQLHSFGIFNWDCTMHNPAAVPAPATFTFDQPVNVQNTTVYMVCGEQRKLIVYNPGNWRMFAFDPSARNCLVAVMPGDRLAIYGSDQFKKITSWEKNKPIIFSMKTIDKKIQNVKDLDDVLKHI